MASTALRSFEIHHSFSVLQRNHTANAADEQASAGSAAASASSTRDVISRFLNALNPPLFFAA
jgi:hypothetical protein